MIPIPLENLWVALLAWAILHLSDYYLTLVQARLHDRYARDVIVMEGGLELTSGFRRDVQRQRRFSPRFAASLLLILVWIALLWYLCLRALWLPELYRAVVGGLVLLELVIHLRHLRNLTIFQAIRRYGDPSGRLVYSRAVLLRSSAADLGGMAGFLLLAFALTGAWELAGGAVLCAVVGVQHAILGRQASALGFPK